MDKIKGGWAGQTIGCTYGGPTEFKYNGTMIQEYVPIVWPDGYIKWWYENVPGLYDDVYMDLTFVDVFDRLGLDAPVDSFAMAFATAGYTLWHANQSARYNILQGIMPPASGHWLNNPHADDLDYQIEADYAGLMSPGMPNTASEISDKIGHIMNYGDGWYGGVYVGAMYSLSFISDDIEFIVTEALKTIPEQSTYYKCMSDVIRWHKEYPDDWKRTWFECEKKWSSDIGCPDGVFVPFNIDAVINSAYILIGLLYGEGDFYKTLDISTRCGQDSDCNPASAGGILGTILGYSRIPDYWMKNLREVENMVNGLTLNLFDFQEKAVLNLLDLSINSNSKQTVVMKAPTGAGKTIILIGYVDEYFNKVNSNTAVIWLCPGKGDLEEQSRKKMISVAPHRKTQNLFDALQNGFEPESTTFINWELVTKRGNNAIKDSERKNLFDCIADAHRRNMDFIVIIDEEHSNNTAKAKAIIDAFAAKHIIRVSATAIKNNRYEYFEIDELDVIDEGLITKALYVNEGVEDNIEISNDYDCLLELADAKRKAIAQRYTEVLPEGKIVRPLVLIQFPNGQPETIKAVETKLESMGYTYDNGMVSIWMSEDKKDLTDNLTDNDGIPAFLLMKQAISTGWDCPRAKILVKLREGMSEQFEIQTIGRIRRMPEARHYDDDLLDFCYVYTFDETYKTGINGLHL